MDKHFCILFSGPIGCSKSPIAQYLGTELNLPILNNDTMRTESLEDNHVFDQSKYEKLRDERLKAIIMRKQSFIYDASVDRMWPALKEWLTHSDYEFFIISVDVSENFLRDLYLLKGYNESLDVIGRSIDDHRKFLENFGDEVGVHITEDNFLHRLECSLGAAKVWLSK